MKTQNKIAQKMALKGCTKSAIKVFNYLQGYFNDNKICFASNEYLTNALGISDRTLTYSIKQLASKGLIIVRYSKKYSKSKRFIRSNKGLKLSDTIDFEDLEASISEETKSAYDKLFGA